MLIAFNVNHPNLIIHNFKIDETNALCPTAAMQQIKARKQIENENENVEDGNIFIEMISNKNYSNT